MTNTKTEDDTTRLQGNLALDVEACDKPAGFKLLLGLILLSWVAIGAYVVSDRFLDKQADESLFASAENSKKINLLEVEKAVLLDKLETANNEIEELSQNLDQLVDLVEKSTSKQESFFENLSVNNSQENQSNSPEQQAISVGLSNVSARTSLLEDKVESLTKAIAQASVNNVANNLILPAINLREAVNSSKSYESELSSFQFFTKDDENLQQYISILENNAKTGILTIEDLKKDFNSVANEIFNALLKNKESKNILDKVAVQLSSVVQVRKIDENASGNSVDDIIARAYNYLLASDVKNALQEVYKLTDDARVIADPWLKKAESFVDMRRASEEIFDYVSNKSNNRNVN